jgi:DNA-binding PadR family transcriptional regulator
MDAPETEEVSRTELMLDYLIEHGPKTEYDLYKQFPKLSHGTIHFCLKSLTDMHALTFVLRKSGTRRRKKLYYLTFIGTVLYLAYFLHSVSGEMTDSEIGEFWEHFEKEHRDEIIEVLERQGKLLEYAPFQEIRWLSGRVPKIINLFVGIAGWIAAVLPTPHALYVENMIISDLIRSAMKEKPLEPTEAEMLESMEGTWRDEFTDRFFGVMDVLKYKKGMNNRKLRELAEEQLDDKEMDIRKLERCVMLFGRPRKYARGTDYAERGGR